MKIKISITDGAGMVENSKTHPTLHQAQEVFLDAHLGADVNRAGSFIQNQDTRVRKHRPRISLRIPDDKLIRKDVATQLPYFYLLGFEKTIQPNLRGMSGLGDGTLLYHGCSRFGRKNATGKVTSAMQKISLAIGSNQSHRRCAANDPVFSDII